MPKVWDDEWRRIALNTNVDDAIAHSYPVTVVTDGPNARSLEGRVLERDDDGFLMLVDGGDRVVVAYDELQSFTTYHLGGQ